jgi:hypothetical protein
VIFLITLLQTTVPVTASSLVRAKNLELRIAGTFYHPYLAGSGCEGMNQSNSQQSNACVMNVSIYLVVIVKDRKMMMEDSEFHPLLER